MKITVILAACADVSLVGSNAANLEKINKEGVTIKRGDDSVTRMVPAYMPLIWPAPARSRWMW